MGARSAIPISIWILCSLWVLLVGCMLWNLDPKFGGPLRWSIFISAGFWAFALIPVAHVILLTLVTRYRWRRVARDGSIVRYFNGASASLIVIMLMSTMLWLWDHGGFRFATLGIHYPWDILMYFFPIYAVIFAFLWPISARVWIFGALALCIISASGGFIDRFVIARWATAFSLEAVLKLTCFGVLVLAVANLLTFLTVIPVHWASQKKRNETPI